MRLTKIELTNFRNYKKTQVSINSDLVLILGDNGSGKTNFLESIYFISTLSSYRGPDPVLVTLSEDYFQIRAETNRGRFEAAVQVRPVPRKVLKVDDGKVPRAFWKSFATVLFVPTDLNLFILGPQIRRRLLDDAISQIKKDYAADLVSLGHVLKQRAALLGKIYKQEASRSDLFVWNQQLAELACRIGAAREEFVEFINQSFGTIYQSLTGFKNIFQLEYKKSASDTEEFLSKLTKLADNEIRSGQNLIGPHREDWTLNKDRLPNIYNSSRGELRSQILALKLLQAEYLNRAGSVPLLLLDDVFSELDETRRTKLLDHTSSYQMIITSTEEHHLPQIKRTAQVLQVLGNVIS